MWVIHVDCYRHRGESTQGSVSDCSYFLAEHVDTSHSTKQDTEGQVEGNQWNREEDKEKAMKRQICGEQNESASKKRSNREAASTHRYWPGPSTWHYDYWHIIKASLGTGLVVAVNYGTAHVCVWVCTIRLFFFFENKAEEVPYNNNGGLWVDPLSTELQDRLGFTA